MKRESNMNCIKKSLLISCAVISGSLQHGIAAAQSQSVPTISSTSGTITTGSLVTINGSQLNNETKLNWDGFFTSHPNAASFEGASKSVDGYDLVGPSGGSYDSSVKILGNQSIRFHTQGSSTNCPTDDISDYQAIALSNYQSGDIWIRAYGRWRLNGGAWPAYFIKMLNATRAGYYMQPENGASMPTRFMATSAGAGFFGNIPSGQLENNRWYVVEVHWKVSSPAMFTAWIDGTQVLSGTPTSLGDLLYLSFGLINLCGTTSAFSLDHWIDGFAVASSRIYPSAIVEVGGGPTYATATKKVQAVEKISDNQIVFKLDVTGLGSGPYYVWVRNNAQGLSSSFALAGGAPLAPGAPINLRIIR